MSSTVPDRLRDEIEEEYAFDRVLPLYMIAWTLAGLGHDRSRPDFDTICREAYRRFSAEHPELRRIEVPWPIDLTRVRPLAESAPVVLDLDPDSPPSTWIQALVHPDELPPDTMDFAAVQYLMGAYFHQDWDVEGGKSSDTVTSFLREPRELVIACAGEIDQLILRDFDDGGLAAQLDAWGCGYYAGDTDQDYRRWLDEIRRQIRTDRG